MSLPSPAWLFSSPFRWRWRWSLVSALTPAARHSSNTVSLHALSVQGKRNMVSGAFDACPTSAYVHIPFCRRRCFYCDFTIVALGKQASNQNDLMLDYVDLVCREIVATSKCHLGRPLETLFFGGGTPSLLPPYLLHRIIDCVRLNYGLSSASEISIEMDPGTYGPFELREIEGYGINRISLGVQSFSEELLKACGRSHGVKDIYNAIEGIAGTGIQNWSVDLISSLPHQTIELWQDSLTQVASANPAHVSVYDLQIEKGTKFDTWFKAGQSPLPDDETSAEFYKTASRFFQNFGYEHYEVSNYAKEGFKCRHNLVYWRNQPYYGFGLGSTSYTEQKRFSRPKKMKDYAMFVDKLEAMGGNIDFPEGSLEDRILDTIMLSCRLSEGVNLLQFSDAFGCDITYSFCEALEEFVQKGYVLALDGNRRSISSLELGKAAYVRLADPEGFLFSNEILASVFSALTDKKTKSTCTA